MTTTTRNYAAEYLAARHAVRGDVTLAERFAAEDAAEAIAQAADKAGVRIDCIGIDEQARQDMAPATAAKQRIVGYNAAGIAVWG